VQAPQVRSEVVTTDDIWIQTESGQEKQLSFTNKNISLRSGQRVSVFRAVPDHLENGPYFALVNHSDGNSYTLKSAAAIWSDTVKGAGWGFIKLCLVAAVSFFGTRYALGNLHAIPFSDLLPHLDWYDDGGKYRRAFVDNAVTVVFLSCSIPYLVIKLMLRISRGSRGTKMLLSHMNGIKAWALQKG